MQHSKLVVGKMYVTRGARPLTYEIVSTTRHRRIPGHYAYGEWQVERFVEDNISSFVMVRIVSGLHEHIHNQTPVQVDNKINFVHTRELFKSLDDYVAEARHAIHIEQHRLASVERVSLMRNLLAQAISKKTGIVVDVNTMFSNAAVLAVMLEAFRDTIE